MTDINALIDAEDDKRKSDEVSQAALIEAAAEAGGMTPDELTQFIDPDYQTQAKMKLGSKMMTWLKGFVIIRDDPSLEEKLGATQDELLKDIGKLAYGLACIWGNDNNTTGLLTVDILNLIGLTCSYSILEAAGREEREQEWKEVYGDIRSSELFKVIKKNLLIQATDEQKKELDGYDKFRFDSHNLVATVFRTEILDYLDGGGRKERVDDYKNQYDAACYAVNYTERVNDDSIEILFGALIGYGQFFFDAKSRFNKNEEETVQFAAALINNMSQRGNEIQAAEEAKD